MDKVFDTGSKVSSSCPDVLNKCYFVRVNLEFLGEPSVVELDTLFLEKCVFVGIVKDLDTEHNEARVMSTSQSNVIEVVKAYTELRADERIGWRV